MLLSWHKLVHPMSIGSYCDMSCGCMSRASKTIGSGACPERCCHPIAKSLRVMSHQLTINTRVHVLLAMLFKSDLGASCPDAVREPI